MRPKRLISLLVAVCMMITMLPLSAVTAFAEYTSTDPEDSYKGYKYAYTVNADGETATITKVLGPVDSANNGLYDIKIPTELGGCTVTGLGEYSFSGYLSAAQSNEPYQFGRNIHSVTIPQSVTSIGDYAFSRCEKMDSLTIKDAATSIGNSAFAECYKLTTLSLGEKITTIGKYAFSECHKLDNVTIPPSVTSIGNSAFRRCYALTTLSLGENIETIGKYAFEECRALTNVTIPEKVKTIEPYTFGWCLSLKYITLPAGLTSFKDRLVSCPAGFTKQSPKNGAIYYNNDKTAAERLRDNPDDQSESYHILAYRNFLYLCKVTFDARGGKTDYAEVPVYKTEKITDTKANELTAIHDPTRAGYKFTGWYTEDGKFFDVNNTAIEENITLYAHWDKAPVYHPLTVTGGTVTVKNGDKDVTDTLTVTTDEATGNKTYYVPDGAEVTVTLDKNAAPKDKVFDGWSTGDLSLPTGQDHKAETITFPMNSDADIAAQYRDAATDHTPDTTVCHPLTVTGGIVTVKNGDKDVTDTLTVTTDEATGKKTYYVPDGAKVTVTLDKDRTPAGMVFDSWSTGNLSLTGQDYKATSITFTMNSDVDIAAQYRDAATDHTPDTAVCHPLTVTGGIVTVKNGDKDVTDTLTVTTDETTGKKTYDVPDGATVTVTLDKTLIPEGMVFDIWSTGKFSLPLGQDYKAESITFPMSSDADIAAQYRDATIEDDGPNVLGTAAIIGTAAVGGAVLGYQAYSLGAEFAGKLMALPYFPSNRSALAMMLWEDAGKPMPESELLYPDVEQEERDMDLQHAARWAMENELIPDLNDEGTAPEEMKFFPANPVSKLDVLNAWQKAQELKNN